MFIDINTFLALKNVLILQLHNKCAAQVKPECTLGEHRVHILPPTSICPIVLDRQRSVCKERKDVGRSESISGGLSESSVSVLFGLVYKIFKLELKKIIKKLYWLFTSLYFQTPAPMSFQISPPNGTRPLLVFVNPKSGGRQGCRILRKFQVG